MKKSVLKKPILLKICSANYNESFVILSAKEIEEIINAKNENYRNDLEIPSKEEIEEAKTKVYY